MEGLENCYKAALRAAKSPNNLDRFLEANQDFHMQIARMAHNREFESLLRGVLERSSRVLYLAVSNAREVPRDIERLLKPILDAIRRRDSVAAHDAVVADITRGQLNALGTEVWGAASGIRRNSFLAEKGKAVK